MQLHATPMQITQAYFSILIVLDLFSEFCTNLMNVFALGQVNRSKTTIKISNNINKQYEKELYTVSH